MKLIAVKHISSRRPKGCVFEVSNREGRVLVAIKAAREIPDDEDPAPTAPPAAPEPPPPATPSEEPKPAPRRGRSFPIGHRST